MTDDEGRDEDTMLRAATKLVEGVNAVPLMEERVARKIAFATGGNFIVYIMSHNFTRLNKSSLQ